MSSGPYAPHKSFFHQVQKLTILNFIRGMYTLRGAHAPLDLINQGNMPLLPQSLKRLLMSTRSKQNFLLFILFFYPQGQKLILSTNGIKEVYNAYLVHFQDLMKYYCNNSIFLFKTSLPLSTTPSN